jgi:hypothetical protein
MRVTVSGGAAAGTPGEHARIGPERAGPERALSKRQEAMLQCIRDIVGRRLSAVDPPSIREALGLQSTPLFGGAFPG